ncbi:MAG: hypothetical protein JW889_04900 [Verrucomicrobia bacterium]|nr:hypothetical protein [Verrucomicrobiota bacterium]
MKPNTILGKELWPRGVIPWKRLAWPLVMLAVPAYYGLFHYVRLLSGGFRYSNWSLHPVCLFLSQPLTVWTVAVVWLVIDALLFFWASRSLWRREEAARPAGLFFLWQSTKFAFFLFYFSIMFTHRPFQPFFDLCRAIAAS